MRHPDPYGPTWKTRLVVGALAAAVTVAALFLAAGPLDRLREFRQIAGCAERDDCAADIPGMTREGGRIRDREVVPNIIVDDKGRVQDNPDNYTITWERDGGDRETRTVNWVIYDRARVGDPIVLQRWHGATVGIAVAGLSEWDTPPPGHRLMIWLVVAWAGLVTALWSPFLARPPGFWVTYVALALLLLIFLAPGAVAYGWDSNETTLLKVLLPVNVLVAWAVSAGVKSLY